MSFQFDLDAARQSLLGTAIGDSLGLPYEGLSARRGQRLMPFPLRQRLIGSKGTVSDDTVQSALVLHALLYCGGDVAVFQRLLGRYLRVWFLACPPGIGKATILSCSRLCFGVDASRSGIRSAGNGAAMRAAVLGAALNHDEELRQEFVHASSVVTHLDERAITGAQIVALLAAQRVRGGSLRARPFAPNWDWQSTWSPDGPTGFVVETINAVVSIVENPEMDCRKGIEAAVGLGGDTDTVGAIVGGILGMDDSIPEVWTNYLGWPQPDEILETDLRPRYGRLLAQHLVALPFILGFGLRRLLPPY